MITSSSLKRLSVAVVVLFIHQPIDIWTLARFTEIGDSDNDHANRNVDHAKRQIDWVRSKGGFVTSKVAIRRVDPNDDTSQLGVFATEDIQEDEMILSIPRECLITSEQEKPDWVCRTSRNLAREMKLGSKSKYAPYIEYLKTLPYGQLPSMWSAGGKDLLLQVTGGTDEADDQIIPPFGPAAWLDNEWRRECNGSNDRKKQHAFLLVIQRGWDDLLIPLYELFNHRNGKWLNTKSNRVHDSSQDVQVYASKLIKAGDEIYGSYTHCEDCRGRVDNYGTPELLRDYGFVEQYPQKFIFREQGVAFTVDLPPDDDDELQLIWHSEEVGPNDSDKLEFFAEQLKRLRQVYSMYMRFRNEGIPSSEMHTLRLFTQSYILAIQLLLDVATGVTCATPPEEDGKAIATGQCYISSQRYSKLDKPYEDYDLRTCDKDVSLDFSSYYQLDQIQSHYQVSSYIQSPYTRDTCFDLDDIYQICGSYRPHYHEMVVHYTARFLSKVERVLFVGGGDSMLLHEVLKYPKLEFVVGLELDQTVTRGAFKHFGTQPHWDNEKVQWWYGDAAKSLLMLPKEYFGTFDMVLVDLSETVMSALVTKDLDIMSALSLLLKPEGIFVKNELYFEKLNPIFKHTIQVHFYDVPVVCSQSLCLGSNGLDFIHRELTDHKVETKLALLDNVDHDLEIVHDYLSNPNAEKHCATDEEKEEQAEQETSPGVLMIVEAENASAVLAPSSALESVLVPALKKEGLSVVSTVVSDDGSGVVLISILREGYVVARTWPEHKYCAFDIHLWSSFDNHDKIKQSLVTAVGGESQSTSSYRIVAGGMFGLSTWREDYKARGPKFTQDCSKPPGPDQSSSMDSETIDSILVDMMDISGWKNVVAAVTCGPKDQECHSIGLVSKHSSVRKTIPLHTCQVMHGIENHEDSASEQYACELELLDLLIGSTNDGDKISLLVVDISASFALAQIINKIAVRLANKIFTEDIQVVAPIEDSTETWRKHFVDEFRDVIPEEPAFMADVLFNGTSNSLQIVSFLSGDDHFITHMKESVQSIESRTGLVADIRGFGGGGFKFQENFEASQWFLPGDYDQRGPYEQWQSQQPTGHQSIVQLQAHGEGNETELSTGTVKDLLMNSLSALEIETSIPPQELDIGDGSVIVAFLSDGTGHIVTLYDGRDHMSLNIFLYEESFSFADDLGFEFKQRKPSLAAALFDEMPRGYGRVVNFLDGQERRGEPHWV